MRQFYCSLLNHAAFVACTAACFAASLSAAPNFTTSSKQVDENMSALRTMTNNHENELRQIEVKFLNLETTIDHLREQLTEYSKAQTLQLQGSKGAVEEKLAELESVNKGILTDLQTIKQHVNESSALLTECNQRLRASENLNKVQEKNIENLQAAVKSIIDALQPSEAKEATADLYQVKSGDTLEKIAQSQGTTIKALKELNGLTTDRIRINQKLKIPAK